MIDEPRFIVTVRDVDGTAWPPTSMTTGEIAESLDKRGSIFHSEFVSLEFEE